MAVIPGFWATYGLYVLIGGLSLLTTALNYLLKPHQKKPNSFDSPTYGLLGMTNSYEPGTPLNLTYGTIQVPSAIINWYRRGNSGKTRAYFVGSLGHGQIAGVRTIKINGALLKNYYSKFNKDCLVYITHGEYQQKVYKFVKEVKGYIISISGTSPTKTLVVSITNGRNLQSASAKEPGYLLLYGTSTDTGKETYEIVRYLSSSVAEDGTTWTLKGVRVTKTFNASDNVTQLYKIEKDDDGNVRENIPHIGSVSTFHQDIGSIELTNSWSSTFTTHGKVDAFSTTFDFPEGLYKFDDKDGFKSNQVKVAVRWSVAGSGSWEADPTYIETLLPETENRINVSRKTNYAIMADASGNEITGTEEDFDYLDDINEGMEIEFTGTYQGTSNTFRYIIDSVFTEPTGKYSNGIPLVRGKIKFKSRIKPSVSDSSSYKGASITGKTYSIYYQKSVAGNKAIITIPESPKAIQGAYQTTYQFPRDGLGNEEKMTAYKQYDIQYKLVSPTTTHNTNKDAHKIVITSIEDIKMDDLVYPGEALIGMRLTMTEKISGSLDNITEIVDGMLVKDTSEDISSLTQWAALTVHSTLVDGSGQPVRRRALAPAKDCQHAYRLIKIGTTGATEPDWQSISGAIIFDGTCEWQEDSCKWNDNPLDIICDLQQNKMYGRGQYLNFDNTILKDLYDSYNVKDSNGITDREYAEHVITENGKARKRLSVNLNIDFRQPLMDTLEVLAKSTRGYNVWDGQKLLTYIDRYRTAVTMVNNANTIPDSFVINEVNVEDKINRFYASILNRYRGYKQDQVSRDYIDEGFAIGDLLMEQIHLYGISDKWHATKILAYMLRYSKYIKFIVAFEQGMDACIYDVGDVFYFSHEAVNNSVQIGTAKKWSSTCGRVIAVSGATFTTDKDVTIANGQKVLLRTDTGIATEYTINSQVGRVITCSATITNVSINSIYSLGTTDSNNEYYRLFTCIAKKPKDYTYEIIAITYDDSVFKDIYGTSTPAQETTGIAPSIVEENDAINAIDFAKAPPPPVTYAIVKEDPLVQGEATIYITRPIGGNWSHAEIYVKNIDSEEWKYAGKTTGDSVRITGLVAGEVYEYEIKSYSTGSISSDTKIHGTFEYGTDENSIDLPAVTGLQTANRRAKLFNVSGRSFKIRWDDMTSQTKDNLTFAMRKAGYEQIKYYLETYFPNIPATVKIGNTSVKDMIARHETIDSNKFNYDYEDSMEDISKIFEKYTSHASYSTYYNVPQRVVKFRLYCINNYSKKSNYAEITLTNPAPGAYLSDGTTKITPTLKKLKSGIRVSFPHPYDNNADEEYDISHIIIERCENTNFTGTTLKRRKVMSSITVNSNDEDVAETTYQEDFKGLDPKKTYYFRLRFYDVFGTSTDTTSLSSIASIVPGITDDDEEDSTDTIAKPATISGLAFTVLNNNNLKGSWTLLSEVDISEYIYDWRGVNDTTATEPPTLQEIENGITAGGKDCYGVKSSVMVKDGSETATKNWFVIQNPKNGYKYFFKVRAKNSSRKVGDWQTSWTTHSTAISGITHTDFAEMYRMYNYAGAITTNAYNKVSWTAANLKFKAGNTYAIVAATNQTVTGTMILGWVSTASTQFSLVDYSTFYSSATYDNYVAIAIVEVNSDTSGEATIIPLEGKDYKITASMITANAIVASKIATGAVTAVKISVANLASIVSDLGAATAGSLTLTHNGGGFLKFKDSTGKVGIRIRVNSGSDPEIVVMKPGQDADNGSDALNPDKVLFSTHLTINGSPVQPLTRMVVEVPPPTTINFSLITSGNGYTARTKTNQYQYMTSVSGTAKRKLTGDLSSPGGITIPLPYRNVIAQYSTGEVYEEFNLIHDPSNVDTSKRVYLQRFICNNSDTNTTIPARGTDAIIWRLEAETFT